MTTLQGNVVALGGQTTPSKRPPTHSVGGWGHVVNPSEDGEVIASTTLVPWKS